MMDYINAKLRATIAIAIIIIGVIVGYYIYNSMRQFITIQNNKIEQIQKQIGE